ncbi:SIR2 family protein [Luteolibacter sp. Populi]|uniref:SIR2 family protein n=1 Tax=Luteolibacter sp. Populi TaxID=3230487 RepID=UPI0034673E72
MPTKSPSPTKQDLGTQEKITIHKELSSELFVREVCMEIRKGYGFTPLVGSGASSRSGILMGIEFDEYLTYTILRSVLSEEERDEVFGEGVSLWNVREDGWPAPPKPSEVERTREWVRENYTTLCNRHGIEVKSFGEYQDKQGKKYFEGEVTRLQAGETSHGSLGAMDAHLRRPLLPRVLRGEHTNVDESGVKAFLRHFGKNKEDHGQFIDEGTSPGSQAGIEERAIRSLFDWRAMLQFLSEVVRIRVKGERPILGSHDPGVIDSFNTHITRGRKPNLTHSMLGHLAGPMRTRIMLTTNFDTLLEDSLEQLGEKFTVIPVGIGNVLPDPGTIHSQNSIVKLHGTLSYTRADFTLDDQPTVLDCRRLFHYVRGGYPRRHSSPAEAVSEIGERSFLPTHLMVIGCSGSDGRTISMLKYLLDHDSEVRIFWVCYSNYDLKNLHHLFHEKDYIEKGRITATVTDRVDLLLLELYQDLMYGLPNGGFTYQFSHDVPPKLWEKRDKQHAEDTSETGPNSCVEKIVERSKQIEKARKNQVNQENTAKLPPGRRKQPTVFQNRAFLMDESSGLMAALRREFNALSRRRFGCVWMEMEDHPNTLSLAHAILKTIAMRLGLFQLEHTVLIPSRFTRNWKELENSSKAERHAARLKAWKDLLDRIIPYFRIQPERWVIFLYGRNVPGMCAGWRSAEWNAVEYDELHWFIESLVQHGFILIYAPYSKKRLIHDQGSEQTVLGEIAKLKKAPNKNWGSQDQGWKLPGDKRETRMGVDESWVDSDLSESVFETLEIKSNRGTSFSNVPNFIAEVIHDLYTTGKYSGGDANDDPEDVARLTAQAEMSRKLAHFLYAISLFRRSRPGASFLADAVYPAFFQHNDVGLDNDWLRHSQADAWLEDFKSKGFVHRKPGGNAWLFRDARLTIQILLEGCKNIPFGKNIPSGKKEDKSIPHGSSSASRSHFWIAAWYARGFFTTNDSLPVLEACHHFYLSICTAPHAAPAGADVTKADYQRFLWVRSITNLIKLIKLARPALLFWLDKPAAEPFFGFKALEDVKKGIRRATEEIFKPANGSGWDGEAKAGLARTDLVLNSKRAFELLALLNAELECLWCTFDRKPFRPVFSTGSSAFGLDLADESTRQYSKILVFSKGQDWRNHSERLDPELGNHWEPIPDLIRSKLLKALQDHEFLQKKSGKRPGKVAMEGSHILGTHLYKGIIKISWDFLKTHNISEATPEYAHGIFDLAYLHVRRAKIVDHIDYKTIGDRKVPDADEENARRNTDVLPSREEGRRLWTQVTALCRVVIYLCRLLPPHLMVAELSLRVEAFMLYGLAQGRLGRFSEAHRRLNEAHAILTKVPRHVDSIELAIVQLRRAEVYLMEATLLKRLADRTVDPTMFKSMSPVVEEACQMVCQPLKQQASPATGGLPAKDSERLAAQWRATYQLKSISGPAKAQELIKNANVEQLRRLHCARLDDAWASLENAERMLSGRTRSCQWWGRLCTLKLKLFAELCSESIKKYQILAFRRSIAYRTYFVELLRLGLAVWPDDPYRRARLADYFMKAWRRSVRPEHKPRSIVAEAEALLKQALENDWGYDLSEDGDHALLHQYKVRIARDVRGWKS